VTTLSHLSPDVLEVVRDVAKQEDSFLLRAQRVPLAVLLRSSAQVTSIGSPFLSAAERHLLAQCRDEVGYALEYALYCAVGDSVQNPALASAKGRADRSQLARLKDEVRIGGRFSELQLPPGVVYSLRSEEILGSNHWRSIAKQAMVLRVRATTLANVALGLTQDGQLEGAREAAERAELICTRPPGELYSTRGFERFLAGDHERAVHYYTSAWRLAPRDEYAACAVLNTLLASCVIPKDVEQWLKDCSEQQMGDASRWLTAALHSPVNRVALQGVTERIAATKWAGEPDVRARLLKGVVF